MNDTYKLIYNPTSGKGLAFKKRLVIEDLLKKYNIEYDIIMTGSVGHATSIAQEVAKGDFKAVVACGGDGTINEIINGLMLVKKTGKKIPALGVIPLGRGNDFICGANIPADLDDACRILADFYTTPMDVGKITGGFYPEGRFFGNGIGIGFDTIVGLEAAKMKKVQGSLAYIFGAIKTLVMYPKAPEITLQYEGKKVKKNSLQISIMNGTRMGGIFHMAPEASNNDGKFNLVIADNLPRRQMITAIGMIIKGRVGEHKKVMTDMAGSRIHIRAKNGGMVTHADGETICTDGCELIVECLAGQIDIIAKD